MLISSNKQQAAGQQAWAGCQGVWAVGAADEDPFPTSCHLRGLTSDGPGPTRLTPQAPSARLAARDGFVLAKHPAPSMCTTATSNPSFPIPLLSGICVTQGQQAPPRTDRRPVAVQGSNYLSDIFPESQKRKVKKGKRRKPKWPCHPHPRSSLDQTPPPGLAVRASFASTVPCSTGDAVTCALVPKWPSLSSDCRLSLPTSRVSSLLRASSGQLRHLQ